MAENEVLGGGLLSPRAFLVSHIFSHPLAAQCCTEILPSCRRWLFVAVLPKGLLKPSILRGRQSNTFVHFLPFCSSVVSQLFAAVE